MNDVIIVWLALIVGISLIVGGVAFYASIPVAAMVAGCIIVFLTIMYMVING